MIHSYRKIVLACAMTNVLKSKPDNPTSWIVTLYDLVIWAVQQRLHPSSNGLKQFKPLPRAIAGSIFDSVFKTLAMTPGSSNTNTDTGHIYTNKQTLYCNSLKKLKSSNVTTHVSDTQTTTYQTLWHAFSLLVPRQQAAKYQINTRITTSGGAYPFAGFQLNP